MSSPSETPITQALLHAVLNQHATDPVAGLFAREAGSRSDGPLRVLHVAIRLITPWPAQYVNEFRRAHEHGKTLLSPVWAPFAEDLDAEPEASIEADHRG
jgi:hypothetical protein